MTDVLRVGMVGYAFMGAAHAQAWRNAHRFFDLPLTPELTAVAGRNPDAVSAAAGRLGVGVARFQDVRANGADRRAAGERALRTQPHLRPRVAARPIAPRASRRMNQPITPKPMINTPPTMKRFGGKYG